MPWLTPSAAGNSSPSRPPLMLLVRCLRTIGIRCGGIDTSLVPASLFGVPTTKSPATLDAAPDAQHLMLGAHVLAAQLRQLPEPHAAPRRQQHHESVALRHGGRDGLQLQFSDARGQVASVMIDDGNGFRADACTVPDPRIPRT